MSIREYAYVGPDDIRERAKSQPAGLRIETRADLEEWLRSQSSESTLDGPLIATYVIDPEGRLRVAPRHSEHVACASGGTVRAAGEITFSKEGEVTEVSNQSTGYCPEPESWNVVAVTLEGIGVQHPGGFTTKVIFRRCPNCSERNIVKDGNFTCALCNSELPIAWNFTSVEDR